MADSKFTTTIFDTEVDTINDYITLIPFGDVHFNSKHCSRKHFDAFCDEYKTRLQGGENIIFLGTGDYNDFASYSDRRKIKAMNLHGGTEYDIDEMALGFTRDFIKKIEWMKGRVIGLIEGNHSWTFDGNNSAKYRGTDTDMIGEALGCQNLGELSIIRLNTKIKNRGKSGPAVDIVAAHGRAGGTREGATINQVEDLKRIFPMADIYIEGHDHRRGAWPISCLTMVSTPTGLVLRDKRQFLCRSGSFLRGLVAGEHTYLVHMLKSPNELGTIELHIGFKRHSAGGKDFLCPDVKSIV